MSAPLRILLIDDHALFAEALGGVLRRLGEAVAVHPAGSAEAALEVLAREPRFDLVLLDLSLPGLKGRAAFEAVQRQAAGAPVVLVTGNEPTSETAGLLLAGARGYVHKRSSGEELLAALRQVLAGGTAVPVALLEAAAQPAEAPLTGRQREVLARLARGESNRDIAQGLGISEATVRVHVSSILRALNVENRTQAATSALARRLAEET